MAAKKRVTLDQDFGKKSSLDVLESAKTKTQTGPKPFTEQQKAFIQQIFEEIYTSNKWKLYWRNFFRGVFFGFGSLVGGTIVVALIVWILSQTVDLFPPVRDFVQRIIESLVAK
jgi:hypothetical protein